MNCPILVLHSIGKSEGCYSLPEEVFRGFLTRAYRDSWSFHTLSDLAERDNAPVERNVIALTFDDAYDSVIRIAFPIMQSLKLTATVFVNTEAVGGRNDWNRRAANRLEHCTWDNLRQLRDAGWEIGSHTHRHFNLLSLGDPEIRSEIETANEQLWKHLKIHPRCLAYPYGRCDARVIGIVRPYFELAVATESGGVDWVRERWNLRRFWPAVASSQVLSLFNPG